MTNSVQLEMAERTIKDALKVANKQLAELDKDYAKLRKKAGDGLVAPVHTKNNVGAQMEVKKALADTLSQVEISLRNPPV